jgi:hypothetical protein
MNTPITTLDSYRLLGRSGVRVSLMPLGTMTLGSDRGWGVTVAASLRDRYEPQAIILVAGASPVMGPLQQTWETFSVNWQTDVKIAFTWLRQALLQPLPPGSRVAVSSGAAINSSPASGGYAGSKATQRFLAGYAQESRAGPGWTLLSRRCCPR